jgi:cystathionine gamma-synthase
MTIPRPSLGDSIPLVPPLYQTSVYTIPDLDVLDRISEGLAPGFIYVRDGHPNSRILANELAAIETASWAVINGSGMAAMSAIVLGTVRQGERIVASNRLYGRTAQLFQQELPRFGIQATLVDTGDLDQVRDALKQPARLLHVETMSNPLLRLSDIESLAKLAHERDCRLSVDNTFATPVLTKPLELGADMVMESLTKMIGGHSDVFLGAVCGRDPDVFPLINQVTTVWGLSSSPFETWLAHRGLSTLSLRMKAACANAAALADWLALQPLVNRVIYPGRPDHPDHELAEKLLEGGYGNMLCFELRDGRDGVNRFMRQAPGIPFSPSLAHTTTTLSHPGTTSHRYVSQADKKKQGISDGLVRLSVGVEDLGQIKEEMGKGLR